MNLVYVLRSVLECADKKPCVHCTARCCIADHGAQHNRSARRRGARLQHTAGRGRYGRVCDLEPSTGTLLLLLSLITSAAMLGCGRCTSLLRCRAWAS